MNAKDIKILIVEDAPPIYRGLVSLLKENGYNVIEKENNGIINNYDDAINLVKNNKPDVAVLDISLKSKKNGFDVAAYIRERYNTFIIMLTGTDNDENQTKANNISADDFIVKIDKPYDVKIGKPYHERELLNTIKRAEPRIEKLKKETLGDTFIVKEIKKFIQHRPIYKEEITFGDAEEIFIKWKEINYIESFNGTGHNNNILIHSSINDKVYMLYSSLNNIEKQLPKYFIRYNSSNIINFYKAKDFDRYPSKCTINELTFEMSDKYKTRATKKIQLLITMRNN